MVKIFSFSTAVRKILSPAMAGEEWPGGRAVFHTTFRSGPNSVGSLVSPETPEAFGPRNCGQSEAVSSIAIRRGRIRVRRRDGMMFFYHRGGWIVAGRVMLWSRRPSNVFEEDRPDELA